jgi:hypothetical protein
MSKFHEPYTILRTFLSITKELPDQFERKRMWGPRSIMIWLMLLTFPDRKTSYRRCLPVLMGFAQRTFGWIKMPSLGSITPARAKMLPSECRSVLRMVIDRCQKCLGQVQHRYGTRRFIAFDGTRIITPRSHDTVIKLHRYKGPGGKKTHYPQGLMVTAVDVFRRLPLDWIFVGKGTGERTAMKGLLDTLLMKEGDVAIMDRGLPSRKLFGLLLERGVDIVARMSTSRAIAWKEIAEFLKTKKKSGLITIQIGEGGTKREISVRLVERDRKRGRPRKGTKKESMLILTTLKEEDGFTRDEIIRIYGARWGIETLFKELKSFMGIEPMHSENTASCEQEICASLIWMALGTLIQAEAESGLKDGRKVVRTDCLRAASDILGYLLEGRSIDYLWNISIEALRQFSYAPKPGRHETRECKMPFGRSVSRRKIK